MREIGDKASIVVDEADKFPHFVNIFGNWPVCDGADSRFVDAYTIWGHNVPKVFGSVGVEGRFPQIDVKLMLFQSF